MANTNAEHAALLSMSAKMCDLSDTAYKEGNTVEATTYMQLAVMLLEAARKQSTYVSLIRVTLPIGS